ncbi:heterokaryon incompatibility protein-domain-containing protein [Cercophora newfieldiana]|uniref:Heterokaryon incompatibility protein-domain-containing protein n=1 Tax=Cercophora newfieldiana TaxID=92897 RepID=A0AA39Y0N0_9PEZI|nr:heterokaryon incompatibility protein-domain-containing protein [Cercophora newfieldiana]
MSSGDPKCGLCVAQANERWSGLPDIQAHAEDGCPYCAAMLQGLLRLIPDIETRFGYDASFRFRNRRDMSVYADPNGSLGYPNDSKPIKLQYRWYTVDEEANQPYQPGGDTSSDASFTLAREWIQDCLSKHALCGKDEPHPLPTRVLDLGEGEGEGEPDIVKLLDPTERSERYIALSHSWGGERPLITTTATSEEHKAGIPFNKLPLTFQDAARIARRLGIRYLWIDSLCIIQDSPEDWQLEASRMASVYRNSWLTVSATASSSPSSGCFRRGQTTVAQAPSNSEADPLAVLFPEATKLRQDLRLSLRFATAHPDFTPFYNPTKDSSFTLLGRAWAYQERLLAPRVLHFGPQELFWECMQDLDCDCGEMKWKANKHMGSYANRNTANELPPKISHYAALHIGAGQSTISTEKRTQKLMSRWKEMVEEYTKRLLTYSSDRLPAFSGVAAEMVDALGMRYCAGHWAETLPIGLLWERENCASVARLKMGDARPAPSWSWASADAPVRFLLDLTGPYPAYATPVLHAEVLEVRCAPSGADERGQVVKGESYVSLSVELLRADLCFEPDPHAIPYEPWKLIKDGISKDIKGPPAKNLTKGSFLVKVGKQDPVMCVLDVAPCDEDGAWIWDGKDAIYCARIMERDECYYWLVLRKKETVRLV